MSEVKKFFKKSFSGFVNAIIPITKNESKGIYMYGNSNLLPNEWIKYISDSGIATRCTDKVAEYTAADGFNDEVSAELKINTWQTADELLQEASNYVGYFGAVAFHISRTASGDVGAVRVVPYQCVRKKLNNDYVVNLTYGQPKFDSSKDTHYKAYYGQKLPTNLLKEYSNGEIICLFKKTAQNPNYAYPTYYSQIEDIRTSSELAKMDLELTINGFMPSSLITVVGDVDDTNKDDYGKTEKDYLVEDFRIFTGSEKDTQGLSGRFRAMLTFAKTKDEITSLQTLDVKSILDAGNVKREAIERAVCRLFGIHPVLMGYSDAAVLGNTQAISNASIEFNKVVNPYQRMITRFLADAFPAYEWNISEYMPIQYIDPALYPDMTQDERRNKFLGLEPISIDGTIQQN